MAQMKEKRRQTSDFRKSILANVSSPVRSGGEGTDVRSGRIGPGFQRNLNSSLTLMADSQDDEDSSAAANVTVIQNTANTENTENINASLLRGMAQYSDPVFMAEKLRQIEESINNNNENGDGSILRRSKRRAALLNLKKPAVATATVSKKKESKKSVLVVLETKDNTNALSVESKTKPVTAAENNPSTSNHVSVKDASKVKKTRSKKKPTPPVEPPMIEPSTTNDPFEFPVSSLEQDSVFVRPPDASIFPVLKSSKRANRKAKEPKEIPRSSLLEKSSSSLDGPFQLQSTVNQDFTNADEGFDAFVTANASLIR